MRICYQLINGRSRNIRFVEDNYTPLPDETLMDGAVLPHPSTLDNPTVDQLTTELNSKAQQLHDTKLALAACLEVMFAFVKNPTLFSTANQLKQAVVERYKTKL